MNKNETIIARAASHIQAILSEAIQMTPHTKAIVVADADCPLALVLKAAYQHCLPEASFYAFEASSPDALIEKLYALPAESLVVLIQTTSFRLNAFRLRVELFDRHLKVIEHPHLGRMQGDEVSHYIDALAYDSQYYRRVGGALKEKIDKAATATVESGGGQLNFPAGLEPAKLNVGDYTGMKNVGGQFPIGEVFTESKDLEVVNGRVNIFAFGDITFSVQKPPTPITLIIEKGRVIGVENGIPAFQLVLDSIKADEGEVWLRELGFGLNRAFTQDKTVNDIGTYERMCGIHLSLGAKHSVYKKPQFTRKTARHHVDVFVATLRVLLGDEVVYQHGEWQV